MTDRALATRPRSAAPNSDFTDLARMVKAAGLMRRRYGYYWTKLVALPMLLAGAIALFVWIGDTWWQMFTAVAFAVIFTQIAFLGHDAAHRQIFRSGRWNDWISLVLGDLIIGMSYGWWQHKHTRHHANPNQIGTDPDIDLPVIAVTPARAQRPRAAVVRWTMAHQGAFFFPILLLEGLSLHASSVRRVLVREHVARRPIEIAFLTIRFLGYLALVFLVLSPDKAAVFLAIQLGLFGFYMGASFAPNHKGMPLVPKGARLDFLRRQVLMSRNIRGNRLLDTIMGGLNYQIEHHLFPSMPRPHLRRAARIIAAYCADRGVPYTQTGLWESYAIVVRHINRVGLGERDPFDCPLVQQRACITAEPPALGSRTPVT
ncbi:fatty acid desaturase [Agromyces flavus]|uniref:Fatty acid desaturase n=1 Tax=Agromyces flavus TaxID=589382 RepID=A0A1H1ZZQ2_9MICO|nr:acyl-CoA desaturase [Agromyces flavus]MCP2367337.1 fatty acid desaturase [Agromyces flavus]GGI45928.1 fatty acid desaturase [Agromyces flavus]SDT38726.1 Fatty acid desaturase [Agromyces flavus]